MLRLLHDRGQAGEFDRRSRLRQRSTRRGVAQGRHRDDRAASQQQKQAAHARSATAKPLYATLARGALLCLDSMAAPHPRPLGILRPELPRLRPARLPRCTLMAILRQVLTTFEWLSFQIGKPDADDISFPRLSAGGIWLNGQVA